MRFFSVLLMVINSSCSYGQHQQYCISFTGFKNYVFGFVEDSTNQWSEYPKPPKLTDSILLHMEVEIIGDDTAKMLLEKLSHGKYGWAIDYEKAFRYIHSKGYDYSLLALTAHWNPDIRVHALMHLNENLTMRPLVNSRKLKNGEWKRFDKIATGFLVYLLESNPLFISGSENATIHGNYISNLLWNLDLLTHENIVEKKQFSNWYKNDLQYEKAVLQWKSHIK